MNIQKVEQASRLLKRARRSFYLMPGIKQNLKIKTKLSLTAFARRVKEGLMMQFDLLELLCFAPSKPLKSPDGHEALQMVFIL